MAKNGMLLFHLQFRNLNTEFRRVYQSSAAYCRQIMWSFLIWQLDRTSICLCKASATEKSNNKKKSKRKKSQQLKKEKKSGGKKRRFVIFIIQWMRQLIWVEYKSIQLTCIYVWKAALVKSVCIRMSWWFFLCVCFHRKTLLICIKIYDNPITKENSMH